MQIIDSLNVEARIAVLSHKLYALEYCLNDAQEHLVSLMAKQNLDSFKSEEGVELDQLEAIAQEGRANLPQWAEGVFLVSEEHFPEYAQTQSEVDNRFWPFNYIDWAGAAEELKLQYTPIEFNKTTYFQKDCT